MARMEAIRAIFSKIFSGFSEFPYPFINVCPVESVAFGYDVGDGGGVLAAFECGPVEGYGGCHDFLVVEYYSALFATEFFDSVDSCSGSGGEDDV